jgi:hypothetical protein
MEQEKNEQNKTILDTIDDTLDGINKNFANYCASLQRSTRKSTDRFFKSYDRHPAAWTIGLLIGGLSIISDAHCLYDHAIPTTKK